MSRITVDQLSEAGFDEDEISEYVETQRTTLRSAGFNDKEIDDHYGIVRPFDLSGIEPFPIEAIAESHYEKVPTETIADEKANFSAVMKPLTDRVEKMGVSWMHSSAAGMAHLLVGIQEGLLYLRKKDRLLRYKTGLDKRQITEYTEADDENWVGGALTAMTNELSKSQDYWGRRAEQIGPAWIDEFVGGLLGSGPGIAEFMMNIPWAALGGAVEAEKEGKSELTGALIEGAKRKVLGLMFQFMGPLNKWLKAPTLGTIFGVQAAVDPKATTGEIAQSIATGFVFGATTPGERMGLNEYRQQLRKRSNKLLSVKEREAIQEQVGKPLMTVDDSVDVSRTAVMFEGRVYTSPTKNMLSHREIAQGHNLPEQGVIRGYIDKRGNFISIYPEEAVNMMQKWEQDGIKTGDAFIQEKEGGNGLKNPDEVAGQEVSIGRFDGPVLRASSKTAKKLMDESTREVQGRPREIPGLTFTTEQKGVITFVKASIYGRDVGEVEIVPKEGGFFLRNINVIKPYRNQGVGENLIAKATEQFGKLQDMTQKTLDGEGFFKRLEEKKPKYAPQDQDAIQLIFEKKVHDAGYVALDTETQQGYKIFQPQRVINISNNLTSQLHNNLVSNKEITFDLLGNRDMDGTPYYAVSIFPERTRTIPLKDFKPGNVKNYILDNRDLLTIDGNNFRGWVDGENVVLDVSRAASSLYEAVRLSKKYGQEAVRDLGAKQEINVDQAYASMREAMMGGRVGLPGIPSGEPETRPRKFLQTVKESITTEEQLRQKVSEIEPRDYEVLHDKDALAAAEFRTSTPVGITQAIQDLRDGKVPDRESGYLGHTLMKKLQEQADWDRASEVIDIMDYSRRDAGRLVRSASLWSNMMNVNTFLRWAQKQLDVVNSKRTWLDMHTGSKKVTITEADRIEILKKFSVMEKLTDPTAKTNAFLEIVDYVARKTPPGISEMIDAYRYQNMLSGFKTQERNIFENTINTFVSRPWDLTAGGMVDYGKSLVTGKERRTYIKNVKEYYKTVFNSMPTALDAFRRAWAGELTLEKPELMGTKDVVGLFEARRQRQMPKKLTVVQRFMEAQDRFFSALISAGEYATQIKNGMPEAEAKAKATEIAQRYLYREKLKLSNQDLSVFSEALTGLGYGMEQFRKVPGIGKIAGWLVPFLRTPINKGITMIEYSPLSFLRRPSHWTQEAQGRVVGAAIISGIGALAAVMGETTWTPPTDEEGKKWFYASNRKAFSIKIGETWVPYWYFGPFAVAFAVPAAVKYHAGESNKSLTDSDLEKLTKVVGGITQFIASQSSAQSIGNFFSIISGDTELTFGKQLTYALGQMIPAQGLIRWVSQMIDPVYRQSVHATDELIKSIPFWTKSLPAHEKPYGEISERDWLNLFVPYDVGFMDIDYEEDFILSEVERGFDYLKGYRNRLNKDYNKGLISEGEYDKKWNRSIEAIDKVIERIDKLETEGVK